MSITKQMLTALDFIHSMDIIHTDIKPENILFRSHDVKEIEDLESFPQQVFTKKDCFGEILAGEITDRDINSKYTVSLESTARLIDFGGAVQKGDHKGRTVNTRQYRSPEVILG